MAGVMKYGTVNDKILEDLRGIVGDENVLTLPHHRAIRASVPAPFPLHKWDQHTPDAVVLPGSTEEVS